ncbi:NADPH:quinone reductase-like Zn-dependent oxidoreductase [Alteromonadaceae bacterium 2753L.S.0a.02]|nr:NADPH:quinone reductase-like Zn-dependent oxidoreductase [Alteromonadaceae bacterium 2753L.S.0a.02]
MSKVMKAVRMHEYGGVEQLQVETVPLPNIESSEVLVNIKAAGVNPVDWKIRNGLLKEAIPHRLPLIPGWDFSGEIVALGSDISDWKIGDAVYSRSNIARDGSYAEYIAVDASEIAAKPQSLDWREAAAVPLVTLTAWQSLFDSVALQAGQKVLIHAGAGGVGIAAIQLAKIKGAEVYTTTSTKNIEFVKDLGADNVIDYTQDDFATLRDLDVVFDTLGGEVLAQSWQTLKPGGTLVSIVDTPDDATAKQWNVNAAFCFVQPNADQLRHIAELFDTGKMRTFIDSVYTLENAAEAQQRSESHRARGKIILDI